MGNKTGLSLSIKCSCSYRHTWTTISRPTAGVAVEVSAIIDTLGNISVLRRKTEEETPQQLGLHL